MEQDQLKVTIEDMLKKGFHSPSSSPFGTPCLFVKKPHDQGLRLVVDWRNLNANNAKDKTQLPNIVDLLSLLHRARYFSIFNGHKVFLQILLCPEDREKTDFWTSFGNYEWNVMDMGLTNAPCNVPASNESHLLAILTWFCCCLSCWWSCLQCDPQQSCETYTTSLRSHKSQQNLMLTFQMHFSKSISQLLWSCHWLRHHSCGPGKHIEACQHASAQDRSIDVLDMCSYLAGQKVDYAELAMPLTQLTHRDVEIS